MQETITLQSYNKNSMEKHVLWEFMENPSWKSLPKGSDVIWEMKN